MMAQSETVIEGTWEQLARHADDLRGKRLRLTVIPDELIATNGDSPHGDSKPGNLAEFLGDFIGSVEGSGAANSEASGGKYADSLVEKHRGGEL